MSIDDLVEGTVTNLIPPSHLDYRSIYRWMLTVALVLGGVIIVGTIHILWACGYLASFGLAGFATNDDVASIHTQLNQIQAAGLESSILTLRTNQCLAIKSNNQQALTVITPDLQKARAQFETLTHQVYILPDCPDL